MGVLLLCGLQTFPNSVENILSVSFSFGFRTLAYLTCVGIIHLFNLLNRND